MTKEDTVKFPERVYVFPSAHPERLAVLPILNNDDRHPANIVDDGCEYTMAQPPVTRAGSDNTPLERAVSWLDRVSVDYMQKQPSLLDATIEVKMLLEHLPAIRTAIYLGAKPDDTSKEGVD